MKQLHIQSGGTGSVHRAVETGGTGNSRNSVQFLLGVLAALVFFTGTASATELHASANGLMVSVDGSNVMMSWHRNGMAFNGTGELTNGLAAITLLPKLDSQSIAKVNGDGTGKGGDSITIPVVSLLREGNIIMGVASFDQEVVFELELQ